LACDAYCLVPVENAPLGTRPHPIQSVPLVIGRDDSASLHLGSPHVSVFHAEIFEKRSALHVRDLQSTNGTLVNGKRILRPTQIDNGDVLQFGDVGFRLGHGSLPETREHMENAVDDALALSQFDQLITQDSTITPFLQPIVRARDERPIAYESFGRSRLASLSKPEMMFRAATKCRMEAELSRRLRVLGMVSAHDVGLSRHVFLNTHPKELDEIQSLVSSLVALRKSNNGRPITLEIQEENVSDSQSLSLLRLALQDLEIGLAYNGFCGNHTRLIELANIPPDYLKFDMKLIRRIHTAPESARVMLASLVQVSKDLGATPIAMGIECQEEAAVCKELGFELFQGYRYGRPDDASDCVKSENSQSAANE
jgi:EAL domain-containing protein (putative c-di-GMP-specific phosphodiesterase class I)